MASISYFEHSCKLSAFIKSLDKDPQMEKVDIDSYLNSVKEDQKETVREIYSHLKSLYSSIEKQDENIKFYCCSYLNYWLDKQRNENAKRLNSDAWEVIYKLWNTLKNPSVSCKRHYYYEPLDAMKMCFDLMVYCVNRDELKQKCQQNDDVFKTTYCNNFNTYTNHYYTQFTAHVKCIKDTNNYVHYNWRFSDSCTLHNVAKTFPKYDEESQTIVDDKSREQIQKCTNPEPSETMDCYMLDGVPVTLEELSTTINAIPLKYGIYASSSFLGFFSLGLYLYKKTRHASLIRTNSSMEKKINKNTDKKSSHEQVKKSNSKNKYYKFSYNPIQN
ncbi:VIR protein [Plasmodium vivax]|uniref:VIR protein n=1 Tax=Plasmodium vivax TaxID=5855 RepID=A0A1G4E6Q0_PLAVI|nr:VIR protein [Plasmodium vivax]